MTIKSGLVVLGAASFLAVALPNVTLAKDNHGEKNSAPVKHKIVTVKAGDTLEAIARVNKTSYVRLFNANKQLTSPDVLNVGDKIRIPSKKEKLKNRFSTLQSAPVSAASAQYDVYAAPMQQATYSYAAPQQSYSVGSSAGNTYYKGYCTWYAKSKRPDLPNMLGNGGQWTANAARQGFSTGSAPRVGAIMETSGHVAYVEKVNSNGTVVISEMNGSAGFGNVGTRTVSASGSYIYK